MEIWNGQKDYEDWIEDLEYHMMGLGLTEAGDARRMLGLFISRGGRKVKEVYNLLKNTPKATVGDPAAPVSEYRHARNIVDEKLKQEVNTTFEMQSDLYAFSACRCLPSYNPSIRSANSLEHLIHLQGSCRPALLKKVVL